MIVCASINSVICIHSLNYFNMKTILILIISVVIMHGNYSQQLQKAVIASSGTKIQNSGVVMTFTVGEIMIATNKNLGYTLGQGFHQQSKIISTGTQESDFSDYVTLYPNPTFHHLNIFTDEEVFMYPVLVQIYNSQGQEVLKREYQFKSELNSDLLHVSSWSSNQYLLILKDRNNKVATQMFTKI